MVVRVVLVCVSLRGTSNVCYHPTRPTHPPQPKGMCVCVQLGMYASPRYVTISTPPTHPPQPKGMCVYSWECMQVQGMLPSPPHPPTPTQRYVCVCVQLGMYASPRYVTIPDPTHPNPKVCVCICTGFATSDLRQDLWQSLRGLGRRAHWLMGSIATWNLACGQSPRRTTHAIRGSSVATYYGWPGHFRWCMPATLPDLLIRRRAWMRRNCLNQWQCFNEAPGCGMWCGMPNRNLNSSY